MNRMVNWGLGDTGKGTGTKLSNYLPSCWLLGMLECS